MITETQIVVRYAETDQMGICLLYTSTDCQNDSLRAAKPKPFKKGTYFFHANISIMGIKTGSNVVRSCFGCLKGKTLLAGCHLKSCVPYRDKRPKNNIILVYFSLFALQCQFIRNSKSFFLFSV